MSSFIRSAILLSLAASICVQATPTHQETEDHLLRDAKTLREFARIVTEDPNNITQSWTGDNPCSFTGVSCHKGENGQYTVTGIDLNHGGLGKGLNLVGLLDKLTDLTFFHANSNGFVGTVPDLLDLQSLHELDLSNNAMEGPFPLDVFLVPLHYLDLRFNAFHDELPKHLFQSHQMETIFLNDNKFKGNLPEFGKGLPTKYLVLANNQLTGPIPDSIANLKDLKEIILLGNHFTGPVPEGLCALDLHVCDVSNNKLDVKKLGPKCLALQKKGVLKV